MTDSKYLTFQESAVSGHISKCLAYFFDDDGRNKYKFSDAYVRFSKVVDEPHITTKRLFNIVRSTNLVSGQILFRQQTTSGFLYFIEKSFYKLVERHHRRISRQKHKRRSNHTSPVSETKDMDETSTSSKSSIIDIPIPQVPSKSQQTNTQTSIGSLSIGETWGSTNQQQLVPSQVQATSTTASVQSPENISKSVTHITNVMEQDISDTMAAITSPTKDYTDDLQSNIKDFVQSAIKTELQTYIAQHASFLQTNELKKTQELLAYLHTEYKAGADQLRGRMEWVNNNMTSYETKFHTRFEDELKDMISSTSTFMREQKEDFKEKVDDIRCTIDSKASLLTHEIDKLSEQVKKSQFNITNMESSMLPTATTLKHITSQVKSLLKQYEEKTAVLDSTIDILNEEIDSIKNDVERNFERRAQELLTKLQEDFKPQATAPTNPVTPQKPPTSSAMFQNKWQTNLNQPEPDPTTTGFIPSSYNQNFSYQQKQSTPYQGVRTDIIRKNVKISCQDETQLLDFYIKLRTAMIQAGIFLREINDINEDEEIYEARAGLTNSDYVIQANALYGFLCNEDVIPQEFTFAQNCIKSFSSTMDGFQTLKRMLVLVHPLLNNRRPPNAPPIYSDSEDLHIYEQELRNFYLLHEIYGRSDYTDLDKAKQFLEGLDGDEYDVEKTRLTAIIDAVELNNVPLQTKHRINSLASTIMNMKNKHNSSKVQINAFMGHRTYQNGTRQHHSSFRRTTPTNRRNNQEYQRGMDYPFKSTYGSDKSRKFSSQFPANPKFSKGQCSACKIYGHHIKDCRFIAPHIAMANFVKQNPTTCTEILKNHIASNTVEHKKTIVRTMQTMGIFDEDADSDTFLDQEEIVDTPTVNKITDDSSVQDTDTSASSTDYQKVQINKINARKVRENLTSEVIPVLDMSSLNTSPVQIQTITDDEINRLAYDADMYDGAEDTTLMADAIIENNNIDEAHQISNLHLEDINCFIDTLLQKDCTVKQFTNADLKTHVQQHWRLKIRVQMDSGASDCITPDKHLLKHFRHVKPREINTADVTSTGCRIEGEGLMDIQTSNGEWLTIKALYVPNASGTIISPTFIAKNDPHFTSWNQMSHTDSGQAKIVFFHRHEYRPHVTINMYQMNNCWYLDQSYLDTISIGSKVATMLCFVY